MCRNVRANNSCDKLDTLGRTAVQDVMVLDSIASTRPGVLSVRRLRCDLSSMSLDVRIFHVERAVRRLALIEEVEEQAHRAVSELL